MKSIKRYLAEQIIQDLNNKMVFLAGPRQVGKTTLSQQLFSKKDTEYLNWDIDTHRSKILKKEFHSSKEFIILDEIHKFRQRWSLEYTRRLFREDLVSLERVEDLGSLEQLIYRLPDTVGICVCPIYKFLNKFV